MRAFLDTSVLVAAFYGDHAHHAASLDLLTGFPKKDAFCGAHSLVEVYATLTRMPGKHRVNPEQAMLFISDLKERLTVVGLTPEETLEMLQTHADNGVAGGTTYDGVLAACALKAGAQRLFTWNTRHYAQLGAAVNKLLRTP